MKANQHHKVVSARTKRRGKNPETVAHDIIRRLKARLENPLLSDIVEDFGDEWVSLVASSGEWTPNEADTWSKTHERLETALPDGLRKDFVVVTDGYVSQQVADREAAFYLGLLLGRATGGAR